MVQRVAIARACSLVSDFELQQTVAALQLQLDRDFIPVWGSLIIPVQYYYVPMDRISYIPIADWIIAANKHSNEDGALGWHDDESNRIISRIFVGDCIRFNLNWRVTLGHEAREMNLNPFINRMWQIPTGPYANWYAMMEASDAVEDDSQAIDVAGPDGVNIPLSNWVRPEYFSTTTGGRGTYDFGGHLDEPCPGLTAGGYNALMNPAGQYKQIQADRHDGIGSARAIVQGHRRHAVERKMASAMSAGQHPLADMELIQLAA